MPRIAYLYSRYPVVSQTFCDSEMLALEAMGFELQIVSLNAPPDSFRHERLDRLAAEIHYPPPGEVLEAEARVPEFAQKLGSLIAEHDQKYGKSFKSATRARNAWHFAPILKRLGISHVHVHFANRATHSALFLKKLGFTFSFTAHAQDFMVDLGSSELLAEMVRESEFTVCVSDFSRELLCKMCAGNEAKVVRIYNGIELDDFPVAQPEHGGPLRLVSIGRLIEFKGFQHLVSTAALLKSRGLDVEVRIIGEGPWRGELEPQIEGAGLEAKVELLGVRSQQQIKRELANAHAFVLPAIVDRKGASDILPTVITEAMACRLPVVSTKLAGIPEMVADGETGLLVESGNDRALADAIARLADDPPLRKRMGEAGRQRAGKLFALSVTAGELAKKFSSMQHAACSVQHPSVVVLASHAHDALRPLTSLPADPRLRVLIASRAEQEADSLRTDLTVLLARSAEWLPDAVVLESLWFRRSEWRQQIERLRGDIGEAMDGEAFYIQARRAVWLAESLPKRGVKHLHAHTSADVVAVWLWKKLTGLQTSAAIEDNPGLSRVVLGRLLADFDSASVSDEKLVQSVDLKLGDSLHLRRPPSHREVRLGPLRLKLRQTAPAADRTSLERAWLERILATLHV